MIEFKDVYLHYGDNAVLEGVSFMVPDAKITAVLGPSGSGKSTIIKLMLGLIKPYSGKILIDGVEISKMKERELFPIRKKMGMVFQGNALFDSLTAEENLSFFLRENLNLDEDEIERRVKQMIQFAQLEGYEDQLPDTLSGGMKKRLAIGRALIFGPSMVLFDEPTVGLDPVSTKRILDVIHRLREDRGLGAVLVTHLIHDVETIADNVLILFKGKIVFNDVPDQMQNSDHPFVASFLKHPEEIE
jgi:phospholipid/cholesterol/gamma-HCH transport system ATP-binding protein